jgi:deoxyxylulose-5-phosphate synthase
MNNINQKVEELELILLKDNEKVFSGNVGSLRSFIESDRTADQVKFFGAEGSAVALMKYKDLLKIVE